MSAPWTRDKRKTLWAFWASIDGPRWKTPQKVTWDRECGSYYHKDGNFKVETAGVYKSPDGYVAFAHRDKKEVQKFINGFMVCRQFMAELMTGFFVDR